MKKKNLVLVALCLFFAQGCFANSTMEKIYDKHQIVYLPSSNAFTTGAMQDGRMVLRKETTSGTGNYSMYFYSDGKIAFKLPTNFEFIRDSRLIATDNANLKYYEVYYENGKSLYSRKGKFRMKDLTFKDVKKIFPEAKVVKVSKFKNGQMTVRTKKDYILLFNDTNEYFYKYSTTPKEIGSTDIKGLIDVSKTKNITFSHYGDDNKLYKKYEIVIK